MEVITALVLTITSLASSGANYVSRAVLTTHVAVSCPTPVAAAPKLRHALPNGPTIHAIKGKYW